MNLLAPLGLALGVTLPIVVVFYLLKVRRHDEEVSSTFLWNDLIRDLAAHEPLQRLRWNVLLLLQLLALGILTVALARPFSEQTGEKPVHAVLLLDGSASMQSSDVQPSRFDRAVQDARNALTHLPENSLATAILVTSHPQVLVAASSDRRQVDKALSEARPSGAAADMREALLLARSLGGDPGRSRRSCARSAARWRSRPPANGWPPQRCTAARWPRAASRTVTTSTRLPRTTPCTSSSPART